MAFHMGVMNKAQVVAVMQGAEGWESFTIDEPVLLALSADVVSLT